METKGVIFEGKTLDDAVKKGLNALGLSRAEVMITVEEEGTGGFLGIGGRPYRVRMMPRPRREMPERHERGERGRREGRERPRDSRQRREPAREERRGRDDRSRRENREAPVGGAPVRDARNGRGRPQGRPEMAPRPAEAGGEERGERRGRRRRRPGNGEGRAESGRERRGGPARDQDRGRRPAETHRGAEAATAVREIPRGDVPAVSSEELISTVQRLSDDLFKAMGFEARLTVESDGSSVGVRAEVPKDSELLTGEKGEVRQALQHLLNRMLNKGQVSRYHVQLEINDFWRQRETELQDLARRLADEAVADSAEKLTEYLNAQERRIVHVTLSEDSRVRTYAIGDGLIKKVAIAPADHSEEQKPDD